VTAAGVFIEGNSILDFIQADFAIMVSRACGGTIKRSARRALAHCSAIYLSELTDEGKDERNDERNRFSLWRKQSGMDAFIGDLPIYTRENLPEIIVQVQEIVPRWQYTDGCQASAEAM
ncbi:MAG: hypothetical protein ND895_07395, partial [Pyrinomonadaceae bacterium]|nr:hypothetical protein [Pyrinomonadaceae bacterium]